MGQSKVHTHLQISLDMYILLNPTEFKIESLNVLCMKVSGPAFVFGGAPWTRYTFEFLLGCTLITMFQW